jgi:hypothetical protein
MSTEREVIIHRAVEYLRGLIDEPSPKAMDGSPNLWAAAIINIARLHGDSPLGLDVELEIRLRAVNVSRETLLEVYVLLIKQRADIASIIVEIAQRSPSSSSLH